MKYNVSSKLEVVEVIRMKKLYCMNCGAQIKGGIPNECSCGAKFDLADTKKNINNHKHYILCSINVSTAYSYSFWQAIFTSVNYFICFTPDYRYFLVSYRTNYFSSSWVSNYDEH